MKSHTTGQFREMFKRLPEQVRRRAREAYRKFEQDPFHPSLHFKRVHSSLPVYSVRIGIGYRAVGIRKDSEMIWFWIGSHEDYDRLLSDG